MIRTLTIGAMLMGLLMIIGNKANAIFPFSKTGYKYRPAETNRGKIVVFDEINDGFNMEFYTPLYDPYSMDISNHYYSFVELSIPQKSNIPFIIKSCTNTITYTDDGEKKHVNKILYAFVIGSTQACDVFPKKIVNTEYVVIDSRIKRKAIKYKSIEEIPLEYLSLPIQNDDMYRPYYSKNIYFVYHEFPKNANKIEYRIEMEIQMGDELRKIDKTYELHKQSFTSRLSDQ